MVEVALYVHALAHTGVVKNVLAVADGLREAGHGVDLVTALPGGEAPSGVRHVPLLGTARPSRAIEHLAAVRPLRRYLRRECPRIAVSMGNHGHGPFWAASRGLSGTRFVYRISNELGQRPLGAPAGNRVKRWLRTRFAARLAADADALVLVSPHLLDDPVLAAAHRAGKAVVIPNGVDVAEARRRAAEPLDHEWLDGSQPTVLAIGRLAQQKNFPALLRAIARLAAERPVRLVILGESRDSARAELLAQARALGIDRRVLLPGTSDNVYAWLKRADVLALPSWWEGSSNVLLEAMAVGTPVVASRTAGSAAILVGDAHGLLVDPADPDALAAAIAAQLDPATRRPPGNRAQAFDLSATLAGWRGFIAAQIERRGA